MFTCRLSKGRIYNISQTTKCIKLTLSELVDGGGGVELHSFELLFDFISPRLWFDLILDFFVEIFFFKLIMKNLNVNK